MNSTRNFSVGAILSAVVIGGCGGSSGDGDMNDNANVNLNENGAANINGNMNDNTSEPVEGLDLSTFRTADFMGAGNCTVCHSNLSDDAGNDVSIGEDWRTTMMANAGRDPFFLAAVRAELAHAPSELRTVIEDTCARCHMPIAHTQAVANGADTLIFDGGFADVGNDLHEAAQEGVSCTLCHQIQPDGLGESDSFGGGFVIDTATAEPDRPIFGPYEDPEAGVMQVSVGYTPVFGEHLTTSALCASCHTLFTPVLDAQGAIVGQFPEQVPYLEWLHSDYSDTSGQTQHCQDCHMPLADGPVAISTVPGDLAPRSPFYRHQYRGGNLFMLRLLRDNIETLGLTASSDHFDTAIDNTVEYLGTYTGNISILDAEVLDGLMSITLQVNNICGHKFPTSFPSRRAWLHATVTDARGITLFSSGTPGADGSIGGNDADSDPEAFEPHYDVITDEGQVQIYEAIMNNTDAEVTYTLLRASSYAKDNRLLPLGFDKLTAGDDIAVRGGAADDDDFIGGSDTIIYRVDVAGRQAPYDVAVELLYQSIAYNFVEELRDVSAVEADDFMGLFDAADQAPAVVAAARQSVE